MTTAELAAELGVPERTLRQWRKAGMPAAKVDGKLVWDLAEVRAWLLDRRRGDVGPREEPLGERIRSARTLEEVAELTGEAAAMVADGSLQAAQAHALLRFLRARKDTLVAAKEAGGGDLLCTTEAAVLVALFEAIVSAPLRGLVVEAARLASQKDVAGFRDPADLEAIRAELTRQGLDGWGDEA